ncbi:hypothetical protein [Janthinobacterium lividum]|uniref:hypothetical protein n=1 Tax=Janthinobacterium lividum TaxID=29581 RepID=UPI001BC96FAB|nr:hypothetical protein [Janthinobacterium lividum]
MTTERSVPAVAALFVRANSIYKTMPAVDAWDAERDARAWPGGVPVVAHPPCRSWGTLRHLAKPRPDEKELAVWAVAQVRKFGGVLEHPKRSTLWPHCNLPAIGERDKFGGWTLPIFQSSFGHRAEKATLLYIVGCAPAQIPAMPIVLGDASHVIAPSGRNRAGERRRKGDPGWRPECGKAEREHTPPELAHWLVALAQRCRVPV